MKDYILVFTANVDKWGAERSITSMCAGLKAKGYNVLVVIPREGGIIELLSSVGVETFIYKYPLAIKNNKETNSLTWFRKVARKRHIPYEYFSMQKQLRNLKHLLKKKCINPILVYSSSLNIDFGVRFAKRNKLPHIQHVRENIDAFGYTFKYGYKRGINLIRNNSLAIVCTCNAIKERYEEDFGLDNMIVVHNGVPECKDVNIVERGNILKLIQTARLMKDKNIMDSIKAIELVVKSGRINVCLDIFGTGEEEPLLRDYVSSHNLDNYIKFKGFCDTIDYTSYQIGLMTSVYEAFARSTLEYMNNSLAVIASKTGGNLEQIVDNTTGCFYILYSPEQLAEKICYLYDNNAILTQMRKASRSYFLENFTQSKYVKNITSIIISNLK